MDEDWVATILDACDFYTMVGIQNLIDRCLLTIDECKRLVMHHLVQEMGREIVRQESPKEPGERSRLWNYKDSLNVLRENTLVESLKILDLSHSCCLTKTPDFSKVPNLESNRNEHDRFNCHAHTVISNTTKSLIWSHSPYVFGIPKADEDMMMLSYWKFENQLESGDELNISVVGNEFFQVKVVGVHLVYKEQEEKSSQSTRGGGRGRGGGEGGAETIGRRAATSCDE
ncbi:hypothetical protein ACSBR1_004109 [Camellia fascicularis]